MESFYFPWGPWDPGQMEAHGLRGDPWAHDMSMGMTVSWLETIPSRLEAIPNRWDLLKKGGS